MSSTEIQTELKECSKIDGEKETEEDESKTMRKDLLEKLKSLTVKEGSDECASDLDFSDDDNNDSLEEN